MASLHGNSGKLCPVCFEAPPVMKVVTTCQHVICRECLDKHLKSLSPSDETFTCPTCQVECPLPSHGVDGLRHFTGKKDPGCAKLHDGKPKEQSVTVRPKVRGNGKAKTEQEVEKHDCDICQFNPDCNNKSAASHRCEDCDLHLCKACTHAHRRKKTTENHNLVRIGPDSQQPQDHCETHGHLMKSYCCTCDIPVCSICIHIGHDSHKLRKITDIHKEKLGCVASKKDAQVQRAVELRGLKKEMEGYRGRAQDRKDRLVTDVEDQEEKCIEEIIKQKETMKKRINAEFDPILTVTGCLDTIPALATRLDETVAKVERLLSDPDPSACALTELSEVSKEMDEAGKMTEKLDREVMIRKCQQLWEKLPEFIPSSLQQISLGTLDVREENKAEAEVEVRAESVEREVNIGEAKLVFEKTLDAGGFHINSVTILGKEFYAINKLYAIHIYRFPGILHQTLTEHVYPAYATAATPDGNLAVLTNGTTDDTRSVHLFHPDRGFIRSTKDLDINDAWTQSFDVNNKHQYVILGYDGDDNMIVSIFNDDGSRELTHRLDVDTYSIRRDARRISCSARYIYVMARKGFAVYEVKEKQMVLVATSDGGMRGDPFMHDISVTPSDQVVYCYRDRSDLSTHLVSGRFDNNQMRIISERKEKGGLFVYMRISSSNDHIVYSYHKTFRVYSNK